MRRLIEPALAALVLVCAAALFAAPPPAPKASAPTTVVKEQAKAEPLDVVYLGADRPAVLRLHVTLDGQPALAKWNAYVEKVFKYLDRDKNGWLSLTEMKRAPTSQQLAQFMTGNPYLYNAGTAASPPARVKFETVDADRDGQVTLDEFKAYYLPLVPPIQIQPSYSYASGTADVLTERLFAALDTNKDGKISKEELALADKVLARFDDNDDELISQAELSGTNTSGYGGFARARLGMRGPATANPTLLMVPKGDSGKRKTGALKIARDVLTRYDKDKDGKLSREECGFPKALFDKIDRNKDGKLNVLELVRWISDKPDAEFTVKLGTGAAMMRRPARGRMPVAAARKDTLSVTLDNVRITVLPGAGQVYAQDYAPFFNQQFDALDKDKKGFITRRQLQANRQYAYLLGVLDVADANADGKLTKAELKAYLALVKAGAGTQLTLSLTNNGQGLFQALDSNGDGQLSVRELRSAWERLKEFDRDKDGAISKKEFPQQYTLAVARSGSYFYAGGTGMSGPTMVRTPNKGPIWFRKMDRNGDGDVSRTEWLGTKEDFDKIDTNGDGLISLEEAEKYDARMRGSARR